MKAEAYERMTASADDHWWYAGRRAILTEIVKQALMERGSQGHAFSILAAECPVP